MANMTIDVGTGNAGAIGLKFSSCNEGFLENVVVKSSDPTGKGYRGVWVYEEPDCLLQNITVEGFEVGIFLDGGLNGMTLENITVKNQKTTGVYIANTAVIRHLTSFNSVPAVQAADGTTFSLLDSRLTGGRASSTAIDATADGNGSIFVRNVTTGGYGTSVAAPGGVKASGNITEFAWPASVSPFGAGTNSLNLPIEETPLYNNFDPSQMLNINLAQGSDFTAKLQWAIDHGGKPVIYLPWGGNYNLKADVHLRGSTVRQIIGFHAEIGGEHNIICDGSGTYNIEHITAHHYVLAGAGTLVVRHCQGNITTQSGATGRLFADDVLARLTLYGPASVWVRRINWEYTTPEVLNQGGRLCLLGAKFEGGNAGIFTTRGGYTETFGIHSYDMSKGSKEPLFSSTNSTVCYVGSSHWGYAGNYRDTTVSETHGGITKTHTANHLSLYRGKGNAPSKVASKVAAQP